MEEVTEDYQNLCTKIQVVLMNVHSSTVTISVSVRSLILSLHTLICIIQNMCCFDLLIPAPNYAPN